MRSRPAPATGGSPHRPNRLRQSPAAPDRAGRAAGRLVVRDRDRIRRDFPVVRTGARRAAAVRQPQGSGNQALRPSDRRDGAPYADLDGGAPYRPVVGLSEGHRMRASGRDDSDPQSEEPRRHSLSRRR